MKKLSLDLNSLSVDTFEPVTAPTAGRGTVNANEGTFACDPDEAYADATGDACTIYATLPPNCV
jgi:hypothetical protein